MYLIVASVPLILTVVLFPTGKPHISETYTPEPCDVEVEPVEQPNLVDVTVSQDAAWTKRGRAMNSLSGIL